jgi:phosphoglycolate phosphatase-like HAD superfamily hydrolase
MDSMALKLESYCHAFEGFGFDREAIRKLQLAAAGLSRYKTIPIMFESLSGEAMPESLYQQALSRFNAHDDASRGKMVLKKGAREFLDAAMARDVPLAIITGTPQEVIGKTVDYFDLRRHFVRVCGSPGSKLQHMERLMGEFGLSAPLCLFAGDAIKDQEAALALGIPFAGVNNGDDPFRAEGLLMEIKGLDEIIPLLRSP